MNAKNVLVEGVRIIGAPMFVVHLLYSENATVRNVMIETYPGPHANGIVVDSSRFRVQKNLGLDNQALRARVNLKTAVQE